MPDDISKTEEDIDLEYTRRIRMKLIEKTFINEDKLPEDKESTKILIDSLSALEKVAIAKKRIKSDNEKNSSMAAIAVELAKVIREEVDPSKVGKGGGSIPEFPENILEEFNIPDFETSEYKEQDYEDFKKKQGK